MIPEWRIDLKDVLITGGAGFVGSNLARYLLQKKIRVTSLDNYFTGSPKNHVEGVRYYKGETIEINDIFKDQEFSHIFHLGEYSRVEKSFEDIDLVFKYNHQPIYEVLRFANKLSAKLIYSGSSTKFGDDGENALASPYANTKKNNTELIKTFAEWVNLDYAIAYFYNVYGDNEIGSGDYATLIAKYIRLVCAGGTRLPVVRPGSQTRNFTHVDDIVAGLYLVGLRGAGDGYGIGAAESYSVIELVKLFGCDPDWLPERRGNRMAAPVLTARTESLGWRQTKYLIDYIHEKISDCDIALATQTHSEKK